MQAIHSTVASNCSPRTTTPEVYRRQDCHKPITQGQSNLLRLGVQNGLPQRSLADELVDCYFENVHVLYPFLHRPTFEAQYEQTWTSRDQQDDEWLALLNVVFALGIHFAYELEDTSAASDRFFGYAQKLVSMEQFAHATIQTLQLLLLSGIYYQSTSRPNQSWNSIGLAIRIASTIGAHVDPTPEQFDPVQIEVRRRCWYGCVVLDSVLALLFGRPTSFQGTFDVSMPSDIDDNYITPEGYLEQHPHCKPKTAVFLHSISFCEIMKDVLYTLYSPLKAKSSHSSGNAATSREFKDAISLDKRLVDWLHSLPEYLRVGVVDGMGEFRRARNILFVRFLNLRVLIHRPFVLPWGKPLATTEHIYQAPLDATLHAVCVTVCRSAAIQLIEVISNNYYQGLSSAWWIDLNYLFSTASVLLAIEWAGQSPEENKATTKAINECLIILREMRSRSSMASTYIAMLERAQKVEETVEKAPLAQCGLAVQPTTLNGRNPTLHVEVAPKDTNWEGWRQESIRSGLNSPSWSMQDLFSCDLMAIDNPMPLFE
ncbi:hypothetical protein PV04_10662 [Phialophora macrospora]|uniref:Xylanolytic transcriptional activator regulatory domain-containing protein n=1 Tax=Phialophora macrospora TaxID=1851006 RepID=A0A0D2FR82_9EURO|nr:hypothetical protein PV04_10662 [Phialophora macrospora]